MISIIEKTQTSQAKQEQEPSKSLLVEPSQEPQTNITIQTLQEENKSLVFKHKSIIPSIKEIERCIKFLNNKFNLGVRDDLIVLIEQTSPNTKGFFKYVGCAKIWKEDKEPFNSITISSHFLKQNPYETIAHELSHYLDLLLNDSKSKSNYHTLKFKAQAERLFLRVKKMGYLGYAYTEETEEFKEMLLEFKPDENAFKMFQEKSKTKAKPSRLLLFECGCGFKIRCAKNELKPLKATCSYCQTEFKEVEK